MRQTDFAKYRERGIRCTDRTDTFDQALAAAVQIVEREGFVAPVIHINPSWTYSDDEDGELYFDVVVSSSTRESED